MTRDHPALLNVVLANAAHHLYNAKSLQATNLVQSGQEGSKQEIVPLSTQAHLTDALLYKQCALQLLVASIGSIGASNFSATLAAVVFLIDVELFYSARDSWRIHLEGAQKLIALLHERLESAELILSNQSGLQVSSLHGYLMEHCLM